MRQKYLTALKMRYKSELEAARINLEVYLNNTVGVADHPDIVGSMDQLVGKIAEAQDKFNVVNAEEHQENIYDWYTN